MKPIYDIKKIESVLSDFHRATGVTITYYTPDFVGISAKGTSSSRYCSLIARTPEGGRACTFSNTKILQKCRDSKPHKGIYARQGLWIWLCLCWMATKYLDTLCWDS